jgi:hypothetical protein
MGLGNQELRSRELCLSPIIRLGIKFFSFSFFNFVRWVVYYSYIRKLSQIWLHVREESRKKVKILALVWVLARTCSLNMANSDCFSLKYGDLGPFSFPGKSLHLSCMAHFIVYGAKIRYKKNLSLTMEGVCILWGVIETLV